MRPNQFLVAATLMILFTFVSPVLVHETNDEATFNGPRIVQAQAASINDSLSLPGPPRNMTLIPGPDYVDVFWEPPFSDGGSPIVGYDVLRGGYEVDSYGQRYLWLTVYTSLPSSSLSYRDIGVSNGEKHYYSVRAVNSYGHGIDTDASWALVGGGPPDRPSQLNATGGGGQANLTWLAPSYQGGAEVRHYKIYRGESESSLSLVGEAEVDEAWHDLPEYAMRWADHGLVNGSTYYYAVSAVNSLGEGQVSAVMAARPNFAPIFVYGWADGDCREMLVTIYWGHPAGNSSEILFYRVYRQEYNSTLYRNTWLCVGTVDKLTTRFNETIEYDSSEIYRVAAVYLGGFEVYSENAYVSGGYCEGAYPLAEPLSIPFVAATVPVLLLLVFIGMRRLK